MKITDYAMVFMIIISSFIVIYFLKDSILFQKIIYSEEINRIVDNTTIKALDEGYKGIGGTEEKINPDIVVDSFLKNMSYSMYGMDNNYNRVRISKNIICLIVVVEDGYYIYEKGTIAEKKYFENIIHEKRILELEEIIQERLDDYNYKIIFPKNNGEHNGQTINLNSLLVIYKTNVYTFFGNIYAECIVSGATVKSIES